LRRRGNAQVNRSQDRKDKQQTRPYLSHAHPPQFPGNGFFYRWSDFRAQRRQNADIHTHHKSQEQPRHDPSDKQHSHRYIGDLSVDDEADTGRNEQCQRAGGGHRAGGQPFIISPFQHLGDGKRAYGSRAGNAHAAHGAKDRTCGNAAHGQSAGKAAQPAASEGVKVFPHSAEEYDLPHHDKQGDSNEDETVQLVEHDRGDGLQPVRSFQNDDAYDTRQSQSGKDGHPHEQKQYERCNDDNRDNIRFDHF